VRPSLERPETVLVYRVSSAKASDLRKFLVRHAKTNSIDALTLAKIPAIDHKALIPLELAEGAAASLRRRVRVTSRLRDQASPHRTRIREPARQIMPCVDQAVTSELRLADLVVLERYADPRVLAVLPPARLAGPAWTTLRRGTPYVLRDIDGTEVTVAEGTAIVLERYQAPEDVRRRRRTNKTAGKAPQVLSARVKSASRRGDKRGDLPQSPALPWEPTSSRGLPSTLDKRLLHRVTQFHQGEHI
jgi:hypothetical protein